MNLPDDDQTVALADLADRAGAAGLDIGYDDNTPPRWWAQARYKGIHITTENHPTPSAAARTLAEMILTGGLCRCGRTVTLVDDAPGCRWQLSGRRWEPGCAFAPVPSTHRGNLTAMRADILRAARREKGGTA